MYVVAVPNRNSRPAILLRESYREGGKVKNRTLANLSDWPADRVDALRLLLKGEKVAPGQLEGAFDIIDSRPHGHVAAALGVLRRCGVLGALKCPPRVRALVEALVVSRLLRPKSKLGVARDLDSETRTSTLGDLTGLDAVDADELYAAMDVLVAQQATLEQALAERHLTEGGIALYDVSSTYFEGRTCPLAKLGYSRDGKRNTLQIVFGLLTNAEGCPVAVEVFEGNVGDPSTIPSQVKKLRESFGIRRVVLVGDRGMITDARIRDDLASTEGLAWITALRSPAIQGLVERRSLQLSLFDERNLAEITDPAFPGERLVVCKNPLLADERARKRRELLAATEADLNKVVAATKRKRNPLVGAGAIGLRLGKVLERYNVAKHFRLTITDDGFAFARDPDRIAAEAALDGIYVVRTSVPAADMSARDVVATYKRLAVVERAFRCLKAVDLAVRPIHHHKPDRVRAHVLLCMLAYHVEWHMRRALAPMLFQDDDKANAARRRKDIVLPAKRSHRAEAKAATKRTAEGAPVFSFRSLMDHLATLTSNRVQAKAADASAFTMLARPTPLQARALQLLGLPPV